MDKYYSHIALEKHELEEETEDQRKRAKTIKTVGSIVLAVLFLAFVIPHEVLFSLMSSNKLSENTISESNYTVYFKPEILDSLQTYYKEHQTSEFKLCLIGFTKNDSTQESYYVTDFYEPKIYFMNPITVHSAVCNESTIIDLHSHPMRDCVFSDQDITTYKLLGRNMLGAVMCDVDRFNFYKN